jgi:DNA primase catalytic core
MKNTNRFIITEIKNKIDILRVVEESNLQLRKRGRNYIGLCPFHNERTPSFSVNPQKNIFKCFGCEVGGDQINLYARLHGIENRQAVSELAKRLGLGNMQLTNEQQIEISKQQKDIELENAFAGKLKVFFDFLCSLKNSMVAEAKTYKCIEQLEQDYLLIAYYHEEANIRDLLEGLHMGIFEEIDIYQQISVYMAAKGVVEEWEMLLEKQRLIFSESLD